MAYKRDLSKPLAPTYGDDKKKKKGSKRMTKTLTDRGRMTKTLTDRGRMTKTLTDRVFSKKN